MKRIAEVAILLILFIMSVTFSDALVKNEIVKDNKIENSDKVSEEIILIHEKIHLQDVKK